jgi:hypothetical protein
MGQSAPPSFRGRHERTCFDTRRGGPSASPRQAVAAIDGRPHHRGDGCSVKDLPDGKVVEIAGAGHVSHVEKSEEFEAALGAFLAARLRVDRAWQGWLGNSSAMSRITPVRANPTAGAPVVASRMTAKPLAYISLPRTKEMPERRNISWHRSPSRRQSRASRPSGPTSIGPGAAARRVEGGRPDRREYREAGGAVAAWGMIRGPVRLAPRPVVRRIGIDEGACGWQVYLQ